MNLPKILSPTKRLAILFSAFFLSLQANAKLIVHEWGTFTSLVGSNGKAQNGMYSEDEALPDFVHNFGDDLSYIANLGLRIQARDPFPRPQPQPQPQPQPDPEPGCPRQTKVPCNFLVGQSITQKMETPVVYFYSDRSQKLDFKVWFPQGIISQSYPAMTHSFPQAIPGVELKNGFGLYKVNILKDTTKAPPSVASTNIYSHARNVNSDLIQVGQEIEKFIFYRGLGQFTTQLLTTSEKGSLSLQNKSLDVIPSAFVVYTDGKKHGNIISLGKINPQEKIILNAKTISDLQNSDRSVIDFLAHARKKLLVSLTSAGLFHDEALAMINTWENGYFKTSGLRVLYVLSRREVENILPIQVSPQPNEFHRVFVGRIEVLLDTTEDHILNQILAEGAEYDVLQLGRLVQPILFRLQEIAKAKDLWTSQLASIFMKLNDKI